MVITIFMRVSEHLLNSNAKFKSESLCPIFFHLADTESDKACARIDGFFRDICVDITYKAVVDVVYIQS